LRPAQPAVYTFAQFQNRPKNCPMKFNLPALFCLLCLFVFPIFAQKKSPKPKSGSQTASNSVLNTMQTAAPSPFSVETSPELQTLVNRAAGETLNKFAAKGLTPDRLAVTLIDLRDSQNLKQADFHGEVKIYPASVVKMFYLAAAHRWLEDGKLKETPELQRGLRDMIVDSSNDATHFLVDVLTDATGGAELQPRELETWTSKRNAVNRYFARLGYENINVNQKTYCEDLYGRERQFWDGGKNRNKLTTNATARLLAEIALGRHVSPARSREMMELLKRDQYKTQTDLDSQDIGFTGIALKQPNIRLWSKAGWTSNSRHDAAYIETPDGLKFVLVTFTEKVATEREIIPNVARIVLENLGNIK
jgi:hypothetical protein